ncbi:hypothetical protein DFH08DRAFT_816882 [Mycena albidolilacea]|uniref:Uncharacterized protein n=1 Tax=Mycena albidolilacea TaxID=1033008 RepID=A0AAD6ZJS3_9AGAR|nr:hypothetical protein DFH08DRAFT_816882 [Mycena albidolilacea]
MAQRICGAQVKSLTHWQCFCHGWMRLGVDVMVKKRGGHTQAYTLHRMQIAAAVIPKEGSNPSVKRDGRRKRRPLGTTGRVDPFSASSRPPASLSMPRLLDSDSPWRGDFPPDVAPRKLAMGRIYSFVRGAVQTLARDIGIGCSGTPEDAEKDPSNPSNGTGTGTRQRGRPVPYPSRHRKAPSSKRTGADPAVPVRRPVDDGHGLEP